MLTKAEIQSIDFTGNTCQVRIPFFENAASTEPVVVSAQMVCLPGIYNGYKPGDMVWVDFENGMIGKPVVISKVYTGVKNEKNNTGGAIQGTSLTISGITNLSSNVTFSGLDSDYNTIKKLQVAVKNNTEAVNRTTHNFTTTVEALFTEKYETAHSEDYESIIDFSGHEIATFPLTARVISTDSSGITLTQPVSNNNVLDGFVLEQPLDLSDPAFDYYIDLSELTISYYRIGMKVTPIKRARACLRYGIGNLKEDRSGLDLGGANAVSSIKSKKLSPGTWSSTKISMLSSGNFTGSGSVLNREWETVPDNTSKSLTDIKLNNIDVILLSIDIPDGVNYTHVVVSMNHIKILKVRRASVTLTLPTNNYYCTELQNNNATVFIDNLVAIHGASLPIIVSANEDIKFTHAGQLETIPANTQSGAILSISDIKYDTALLKNIPIINIYTKYGDTPIISNAVPDEVENWKLKSTMVTKL